MCQKNKARFISCARTEAEEENEEGSTCCSREVTHICEKCLDIYGLKADLFLYCSEECREIDLSLYNFAMPIKFKLPGGRWLLVTSEEYLLEFMEVVYDSYLLRV
jgi:hypothetical protein